MKKTIFLFLVFVLVSFLAISGAFSLTPGKFSSPLYAVDDTDNGGESDEALEGGEEVALEVPDDEEPTPDEGEEEAEEEDTDSTDEGEGEPEPEIGNEGKVEPIDLSIAPAPRHEIVPPDEDAAYGRVEFVDVRKLPNWTYVYKVFDAEREFRGRLIVRKFEANDLRYGRLVVLDKEYMFTPQRVIRVAYRKDSRKPVFMWMTYQFGDKEKKFTADYYYDQIFIRAEDEKVFYHNSAPNPPASFDSEQLIWTVREMDIDNLSGWRLININIPTLEESFQVRVLREDDVEVKGADFKKYYCAHLVFDFGFVNDTRVKEHYFIEIDAPNRLIQYASGNILFLFESERQGSKEDDLRPGEEVREMPELPDEDELRKYEPTEEDENGEGEPTGDAESQEKDAKDS